MCVLKKSNYFLLILQTIKPSKAPNNIPIRCIKISATEAKIVIFRKCNVAGKIPPIIAPTNIYLVIESIENSVYPPNSLLNQLITFLIRFWLTHSLFTHTLLEHS